MYYGLGRNRGFRVNAEEAFLFAIERCTTNEHDMEWFSATFGELKLNSPNLIKDFRSSLVELYYAKDWIWKEKEQEK